MYESTNLHKSQSLYTTQDVQAKESFPEILNEMKSAICELGGRVFPKCGWSSPKDAEWVFQDSTLKCSTPGK